MRRRRRPVVGHITDCYFKLSENWIHTQMQHLERWRPVVLANDIANLDTVEWRPPCVPRWRHLPRPIGKLDALLQPVLGYGPVHYAASRWYGAHLLHAHFGPEAWSAIPLARSLDVPLVTTFYGYDLSRLPNEEPMWVPRYRALFAAGDAFLVEGPHMARQLELLGCPPENITIHQLGIAPERFPYAEREAPGPEGLQIIMAGRFVEKKGFPDAVAAFARFIQDGGHGHLTIIGDTPSSGSHPDIKGELKAIVSRIGLEDRVTFAGFVPHEELRERYYDHHVFLSPSRTASNGDIEGGAPVSIIEAQATGLVVVATRHCDIPNVVAEGETGLLAEEGDVEALAHHLMTLYRSPSRLAQMGRKAHERMQRRHNAHRQAQVLETLYDTVVRNADQ